MHNKSFFNRVSFVFVALLYLSFYLFSPLFHYHDENSILEEGKEVDYHTHLLQEVTKKTNTTECHHQLDQNDEHNHPLVINAVITNLPSRSVDTTNSLLLFFDIVSVVIENGNVGPKYIGDFHFGKVLKEKCVHFASNVSPPFVLAS